MSRSTPFLELNGEKFSGAVQLFEIENALTHSQQTLNEAAEKKRDVKPLTIANLSRYLMQILEIFCVFASLDRRSNLLLSGRLVYANLRRFHEAISDFADLHLLWFGSHAAYDRHSYF